MTTGSIFDVIVTGVTGVASPFGQMTALLSALSFNRNQETEADILGAKLVANAGYDPHATYRVWVRILEEEEAAAVKREDHGIFANTHPASENRADYLEGFVTARYGLPDQELVADEAFLKIMNMYYMIRMCEVAVQAQSSGLALEPATPELWERWCRHYESFSPGINRFVISNQTSDSS